MQEMQGYLRIKNFLLYIPWVGPQSFLGKYKKFVQGGIYLFFKLGLEIAPGSPISYYLAECRAKLNCITIESNGRIISFVFSISLFTFLLVNTSLFLRFSLLERNRDAIYFFSVSFTINITHKTTCFDQTAMNFFILWQIFSHICNNNLRLIVLNTLQQFVLGVSRKLVFAGSPTFYG